MGDMSKNLSRSEFSCPCGNCEYVNPPDTLLDALQDVRDHFKSQVKIELGHVCEAQRIAMGKSVETQHAETNGVDFSVKGISSGVVSDYLDAKYPNQFGIGTYPEYTHLDMRQEKTRWVGSPS